MKRQFVNSLIVLLTLAASRAAMAAPPTPAPAAAGPQTGSFTIDGMPVDNKVWAEVERRQIGLAVTQGFPNQGVDGKHPESPQAKTHLICWVSDHYQPDGTWGLLVMPTFTDTPAIPGGYPQICEKHRLLMVTATDGGNNHYRNWRVGQALVARQEMLKRYKINLAGVFDRHQRRRPDFQCGGHPVSGFFHRRCV